MTREEWLARCATAYDVGLVTAERLELMARWLDLVMREGHSRMTDRHSSSHGRDRQQSLPEHNQPTQERSHHPHTPSASHPRTCPAQWERVDAFWYGKGGELERLECKSARMFQPAIDDSTNPVLATLANDIDGYALIQIAAIFAHPCQCCATDPGAWWTRPECCQHPSEMDIALSHPFTRPALRDAFEVVASTPETAHKSRF